MCPSNPIIEVGCPICLPDGIFVCVDETLGDRPRGEGLTPKRCSAGPYPLLPLGTLMLNLSSLESERLSLFFMMSDIRYTIHVTRLFPGKEDAGCSNEQDKGDEPGNLECPGKRTPHKDEEGREGDQDTRP